MIIKTRNNLTDYAEKSYLTNQEVSGTNTLRWKNSNVFTASWAIQVGETGEEQTEIVLLGTATPAGTAGTLTGNSLYEHPADTPLYAIKYDQVVFEVSTVGTAGTATPITGGTITIQPDSLYTNYDHTSGSVSYAYKTYFRNSVLNVTTTESDWITSAGFSFYSLANIRQRVKDALWNAEWLTDDVIDAWTNEWKDELTNAAIQVNEDYAIGTVAISFGTSGLGTVSSADFKQPRRIWVTYDGVNSYQSTKMSSVDYLPDTTFSSTHPKHDWQGDNIFQIHPSDSAGTANLEYYKINYRMVNDTDELPTPMKAYTSSFVDYGLARASFKDGKAEEFGMLMQKAGASKGQFIAEISPRDKSGPDYVKITDTLSGNDGSNGWW